MSEAKKLQAKKVLLEIIRQFGGRQPGTAKLQYAFYVACLFSFEESGNILSDWPMQKLSSGPGIYDLGSLLLELIEVGAVKAETILVGPYPVTHYRIPGQPVAGFELPEEEASAITKAVQFVQPKSDLELLKVVQDNSRSWQMAQMGEFLSILIDAIPEDEYLRRQKELQELEDTVVAHAPGKQLGMPA